MFAKNRATIVSQYKSFERCYVRDGGGMTFGS